MDGTGELFNPLLDELPEHINTHVICLNSLTANEPKVQAIEIASTLGDEEVIILSESYSSYIAYQLCLLSHLNIKHVIFSAGFLSNPSKLSYLRNVLPLNIIRSGFIPGHILSLFLFAQRNNDKLVKLFNSSLQSVTNFTLKQRLEYIANLTTPAQELTIPATYVQASNDYLVSKKSVDVFTKICININVVKAEGGHFVVQSNPQFFVKLIQNVMAL